MLFKCSLLVGKDKRRLREWARIGDSREKYCIVLYVY